MKREEKVVLAFISSPRIMCKYPRAICLLMREYIKGKNY